ncbi:hypothetical protein QOZ80_2BG0200150 [Eleusine coracana subsp. coracana]|nr:hypothetical protein QOZ80_2BG0200150 [Eleusine coracana subsp. coracana]
MKDQADIRKNQKIRILHYQRNVDWGAQILISCLKMSARRLFGAEAVTDKALEQQVEEVPAQVATQKRKHGQRSVNKVEGIYEVTALDPKDGEPIEPAGVNAKWRNRCGKVMRDHCKITWQDWRQVPDGRKDDMWADVMAIIQFQPADLERAKKATMSTLNHIFQDYKSKLNCQYVKKNRTLFDKHGNISQQEWDEFVEQKTSSASKELSEKMVELNKRDKFKARLGSGRYKKKIPIWREQEAKLHTGGKPDPLPNTNERTRNWVYGRIELIEEGEIIVKDHATSEFVQALKGPIAAQTEAGLFTPEYHKNELAKAIGTKEHGGRVRGVSSSATWKEGFSETSSHLYKKHTLHKKEQEDKAKEDWRQQLLMFAIDKESGRLDPNLQAAVDAFIRGKTLHNRDIPPGYVRVTVSEIVPGYKDNEIECPIPEIVQPRETIQVKPPLIAATAVQVQAPVIQVQHAPVIVKASVIPKMITGFDKEPRDPKARNDVDKYLAGLKKCLASTGKLVIEEQDPRDKVSYDDYILDNPVDDVDYPTFKLDKPLISNNMYKNLPWEMRKLHDWYMMSSKEEVTAITCRIPIEVFNEEDDEQTLGLFWEDVHLMFHLGRMDITFITLWCM